MVASVVLSASAGGVAPLQPSVQGVVPGERVDAFRDAMSRAGDALQSVQPSQAIQGGRQPTAASEAGQVDLDAKARARRGLGLDGAEAATGPAVPAGDMILGGLQKLRGVFDAREARLSDVMASGGADSRSLMAMQIEMTNFTMLVDISSKLTGKTTQVFDTLMKGQ